MTHDPYLPLGHSTSTFTITAGQLDAICEAFHRHDDVTWADRPREYRIAFRGKLLGALFIGFPKERK